ncbi:hypothetical protein KK137_10895 [Croceibacterium sp. LX-88]|uniref:Uncharacterized protein n=1 Tax=Croceibacterium selenioxidans TaxID=2838833 RepID=A0ABS5W675_9SPHN|nr:hypothetical protein [Croceibacterium selenioxidans]MBT2134842.1 hypothetical protein [Croceibacterium selenioxidans]
METVKTLTSRDDKHRIDIERSEAGLYRYVTFNDRYRTDEDFQNPPYWMIEAFSGLYQTAEAAEADARAECAWLGSESAAG